MSANRTIQTNFIDGVQSIPNYIGNGKATYGTTAGFVTYSETDAVTFQDAGDTVTLTAHGLQNNYTVSFTSITSTTGITANTLYYVVGATTNTFQVASTLGGSALALTTNGSGTLVRYLPKTGASAGSPAITYTTSSSAPLSGDNSFLYTKGASNLMGNGVSYDFTINTGDQAKVHQIQMDMAVLSGTFAAGTSTTESDVEVWIYDVTNATLIQPSSYKFYSNSSVSSQFIASFQTASNSTSYRLIMHTATVSATAYVLKLDSISVSPTQYIYGTPMNDGTSYTPTLGPGFGAATNISFKWKREGDSVRVYGTFTTGTVAANTSSITLPPGLVLDTTKITINNNSANPGVSVGEFYQNGSGNNGPIVTATATSTTQIYLGGLASSSAMLTPTNTSGVMSSTQVASINFLAPIAGWSASVQMSDSADTRVVAAEMTSTATPSISNTTWTQLAFATVVGDTHSAYSTGTNLYTVPVSGRYRVTSFVDWATNSTGSRWSAVFKNGSFLAALGVAHGTDDNINSGGSVVRTFNAGDTIGIYVQQNSGGSLALQIPTVTGNQVPTGFMVERLSGPAAIAASEKVYLQYKGNAGTSITALVTNVDFTTKVVDSHGAWSGTLFTAPKPAMYSIFGMLAQTAATNGQEIDTYVNGVRALSLQQQGSSEDTRTNFNGAVWLNAGDTFSIRLTQSATLNNNATIHHIAIMSQG